MIARAAVVRPDLPVEMRQELLAGLAETAQMQGKLLMQVAKDSRFDPAMTAEAIAPLLLDLPREAVFAISSELDALLDSETPGLRSAAIALKVRSGAPLGELAERDPAALLDAVTSLSSEQTPDTLPSTLVDLAKAGKLDAGVAILQANRLSSDKTALFERLSALADPAMELSYEQWGPPHILAMAALAGMHQTPDADWPAGYDKYRVARADEATLQIGKDIYFTHDQGCYKCHGEHGEGTSGFPPLAGSPMITGDPVRAAKIIKHGLQGELAHTLNPADGKPFNAQMEPLSQFNEAQMAAALTYIRQSWGNFASPVTVQAVATAKGPKQGMMWDASLLLAKHPFERDRLTGPLPPPSINLQKWSPPSIGLPVMLLAVGFCMLLILVATYAGKFLNTPHTPTPA